MNKNNNRSISIKEFNRHMPLRTKIIFLQYYPKLNNSILKINLVKITIIVSSNPFLPFFKLRKTVSVKVSLIYSNIIHIIVDNKIKQLEDS